MKSTTADPSMASMGDQRDISLTQLQSSTSSSFEARPATGLIHHPCRRMLDLCLDSAAGQEKHRGPPSRPASAFIDIGIHDPMYALTPQLTAAGSTDQRVALAPVVVAVVVAVFADSIRPPASTATRRWLTKRIDGSQSAAFHSSHLRYCFDVVSAPPRMMPAGVELTSAVCP